MRSEFWKQNVREYADEKNIPFRKALTWAEPYDLQEKIEWVNSLPEYDVVDLEIGGIIGIEQK